MDIQHRSNRPHIFKYWLWILIENKYWCQQGHCKIPSTDENKQAEQLTKVLNTSISWASISYNFFTYFENKKKIKKDARCQYIFKQLMRDLRFYVHVYYEYAGMTFKAGYRILMMIVLQQWGCTWEWDTITKYTRWRITLWHLIHKTGTILLRGGKVSLKEWLLNKCLKSQGLTTTAGAWIPSIAPDQLMNAESLDQILKRSCKSGNLWVVLPIYPKH